MADEPGVLAAIAGVFGDEGVSIHSMQQSGAEDAAQLVLVLHPVREAAFFGALARIEALPVVRSRPSVDQARGSRWRSGPGGRGAAGAGRRRGAARRRRAAAA